MNKDNKNLIKKSHILDCLEKCLQTNSFENISFDDICKKCNMSKGGLRHYFSTKNALYNALIERFLNKISMNHSYLLNEIDNMDNDKVLISALYDFENFFNNEFNVKIFLNIIQFSFLNKKVMNTLKNFLENNFELYIELLENKSNKNIVDLTTTARTIQIILLTGGFIQAIDYKDIDNSKIIRHILDMVKQ